MHLLKFRVYNLVRWKIASWEKHVSCWQEFRKLKWFLKTLWLKREQDQKNRMERVSREEEGQQKQREGRRIQGKLHNYGDREGHRRDNRNRRTMKIMRWKKLKNREKKGRSKRWTLGRNKKMKICRKRWGESRTQ